MAKACAPMKGLKGKPDTDQDEKGKKVTKAQDFDKDEWLKGRKYMG